ncbi:MAG: aldehyde dehydrogenase family protein [Brachymonas sp.]
MSNKLPHNPSAEQMQAHLQAMKKIQRAEGPVSAAVRQDRIKRAMDMFINHVDEFTEASSKDFGGRPPVIGLQLDGHGSVAAMKYNKKNLAKWMKPSKRATALPFNLFGGSTEVRYQPKGVIGIAGTWNASLFTVFAPLAGVLAAGNRAMIKPSDLSPHMAEWLQKRVPEYFDPMEVALVTGDMDVSQAFTGLPFDHLVYTGGGSIAKHIMRAAAENLVPLTLELGGKSPTIFGISADLEKAMYNLVTGKGQNNGQICVSPDTIYVHESKLEEFVQRYKAVYAEIYGTGPVTTNSSLTPAITERHLNRVENYVKDAAAKGARIEWMAQDAPLDLANRRRPMRLVINAPQDALICNEEIFGAAALVRSYKDIKEVVGIIQQGDYPLALYYFGKDKAEEEFVLQNTLSGGVVVNDVLMHVAMSDAPFGGVGASGMGRYNGKEGFLEFSHHRLIYRTGWWDPQRKMGLKPPFIDPKKTMDTIIQGLKSPI